VTLCDLDEVWCVGVVSLLSGCCELTWLDVTGCIHVSETSLTAAVDVIEREQQRETEPDHTQTRRGQCAEDHTETRADDARGRAVLTLCVGGTSVSAERVTEMTLPTRLSVDTHAPYDIVASQLTGLYHSLTPE